MYGCVSSKGPLSFLVVAKEYATALAPIIPANFKIIASY